MEKGKYYEIYIRNIKDSKDHIHAIVKGITTYEAKIIHRISGGLWEHLDVMAINPKWIKREIKPNEHPEYFI